MSALDHRIPLEPAIVLADGTAVSVRPARPRDLDAVHSLAVREGVFCDELELARLLRSDPAERLVLCATTHDETGETVIGIGVIELRQAVTMPSLVLVDPVHGSRLAGWLVAGLLECAGAAA